MMNETICHTNTDCNLHPRHRQHNPSKFGFCSHLRKSSAPFSSAGLSARSVESARFNLTTAYRLPLTSCRRVTPMRRSVRPMRAMVTHCNALGECSKTLWNKGILVCSFVCKYGFLQTELQTEPQTLILLTSCISRCLRHCLLFAQSHFHLLILQTDETPLICLSLVN